MIKIKDLNSCNIQVKDSVLLPDLKTESSRTLTPEGYLQATAAITRVGVQMYSATDFGIDSDELVGVLRPPETVFHSETVGSAKLKPIALLHPEQDVDSTNHSRISVGAVGENVEAIDSERLGASIQITDDAVVKQVLGREVEELSLGYDVFIVSEEGTFNGQQYVYKMDGPMIINHLAIVPEGRCGDSVKILDKGASIVNKKEMIKALKDAGVSDDLIKAFMKDAKDTDKGDFKEYTKLLMSNKDIDVSALIPGIVAELKPTLEELVGGDEFKAILAKEIAATMVGGSTPAEPDAAPDDAEGDPEPTEEAQEKMDAAISDAVEKRSKLVDKASPYIKDEKFDIYKAKDRDILEKALGAVGMKAEDMKDKSDDYLTGILDSISEDRQEASKFMSKDWQSKAGIELKKPMSAIEFKNQK